LKRFPRSTNGKQEGPADRAGFCAERAGSPLAVAASMFRMAHEHVTPANLSRNGRRGTGSTWPRPRPMRRQIGEALHALQEAECIAPEETRIHYVGRAVTRDLLQLSGLRPRPELRDLAERFGVLP